MDKLEMKQDSLIQTQYFIPVEIDMSVLPARLGISDFFMRVAASAHDDDMLAALIAGGRDR